LHISSKALQGFIVCNRQRDSENYWIFFFDPILSGLCLHEMKPPQSKLLVAAYVGANLCRGTEQ